MHLLVGLAFDQDRDIIEDARLMLGFACQFKPDSFILITGHYDHLGHMGELTYFPGANDNASGISMLLNLAEHFSKAENKPNNIKKYFIIFSMRKKMLMFPSAFQFFYLFNYSIIILFSITLPSLKLISAMYVPFDK